MAILTVSRTFIFIAFILSNVCIEGFELSGFFWRILGMNDEGQTDNEVHSSKSQKPPLHDRLYDALPNKHRMHWSLSKNEFKTHCKRFEDAQNSRSELRIEDDMEMAMFFANVFHETGCFRDMEEIGNDNNYGHNQNGVSFKGRGYLQLVGFNYFFILFFQIKLYFTNDLLFTFISRLINRIIWQLENIFTLKTKIFL